MNDVRIEPWLISRVSPADDFSETVFFVGNGRLGVRGFGAWEQKSSPQAHAIFRAGLFSEIKTGITDMVELPDTLTLRPVGEEPVEVAQTLDMRSGVLSQAWETERASVLMERAASMADEQLILQRLTLTAKRSGEFVIEAIADADVCNLPVNDDQTKEATEFARLLEICDLRDGYARLATVAEKTPVTLEWTERCDREARRELDILGTRIVAAYSVSLREGESVTVEKRVRIRANGEPSTAKEGDPWSASAEAWARLWHDCDIEIDADDPDLQGALRYNIFQLLCSNAADDRRVSIGARGLTHGRYKGNTFWDTDIFLLPFYLWTRPQAAKSLMLYRADRLPDAMELAAKQSLEGARFPWMCSDTGREQCESWDIGQCEVHITADVAYAAARYIEVTGDDDFLSENASVLYRETARYWRSRLTYEPREDRYSSFFVKGPDEYCGAAVNNTYTNYMARNNLRLAAEHGGLNDDERELTLAVAERVTLLYDKSRRLYLQDETLDRLPPFERRADGLTYKSVCFDRMQRYRAIKQADLVLLMTLFPGDFTQAEKRAVFDAYEPITVHDSTLSYGVHAQLAMRLGLWDKAREYLDKAVYLDLRDVMGNTAREGVHMAALGAAWQAIVFGAVGLWSEGGSMSAEPMLPPGVSRIALRVRHHGRRYRLEVNGGAARITEEDEHVSA